MNHVVWLSDAPLSTECVQHVRALRPSVRVWLADDFAPGITFEEARAVIADDGNVIDGTQFGGGGSAVALYTTDHVDVHSLPQWPSAYKHYYIACHTADRETDDSWIVVQHALPPQAHNNMMLLTMPHLLPCLRNHEFTLYVAPGASVDCSKLNRALVNMLHAGAYFGACAHFDAIPQVMDMYEYFLDTKPACPERTLSYIFWRLSHSGGGLKRGTVDDVDGLLSFDTDVVLRDMRHPRALHFSSQWHVDTSWSVEPRISLFFTTQLVPDSALTLSADVSPSGHGYSLTRFLKVPPRSLLFSIEPSKPCLIPPLLHIVWLGDAPLSDAYAQHVFAWRRLMPSWTVKVWRDGSESEFGKDVEQRVRACTAGAQKADVLRAFILEKYGGFYVDADVAPRRSLEPLRHLGEPVLLCHDIPVTWNYVMNAFIAAAPCHPLIQAYCRIVLRDTEINTHDIHLQTGPRALGRALREWTESASRVAGDKVCLLPIYAFYHNPVNEGAFGMHKFANSWECPK